MHYIQRKYRDANHPDHNKIIATELTLEEAQAHCKDPATHEAGVWFDCYYEGNQPKASPYAVSATKALQLMY